MEKNPRCNYDNFKAGCTKPDRHDGWLHAKSWEEVEDALERGLNVRDEDGDNVLAVVDATRGVYRYRSEDAEGENCPGFPEYILIEDWFEPVTENEMAELMSRLGVETAP